MTEPITPGHRRQEIGEIRVQKRLQGRARLISEQATFEPETELPVLATKEVLATGAAPRSIIQSGSREIDSSLP